MKRPPVPKPSPEQLRATYAREAAHRPHWPRTFEAAQADPLIAAIIRTLAAHPPASPRRAPPTQSRFYGRTWVAAPAAGQLDRKRLAAGEKPDDQ